MQLPSSSSSTSSSPSPSPSPSLQFQFLSQSQSQSQSDEKKNLYICLNTDVPKYFHIRSIPANSLFNKKQKRKREPPPPPLNEVFSASSCDGMMGCAVLGSTLYVVGGGVESKSVFGYNTANRSSFTVPDMISRKCSPFVLPVGERLYVLYSYPDRNSEPPVFEVYDPSTNKWEQLDPPPFLNPMDKKHFYSFGDFYCCAVIGTSICVSTDETAFKFDTQHKIWEPCMLFEVAAAADLNWISHVTTPTPCCGPPFGFLDQAVLFDDDILICMHEPVKGVFAYKIDGGKVVGSQYCLSIPHLTVSSYIAELGNGAFCLVLTQCQMDAEDCRLYSPILIVKPFLIKKKTGLKLEGGQVEDFLDCEVFNEFIYTQKFLDLEDEIWHPIYCFVQ